MKKIKVAVKDNKACLLSPVDLIAGTVGLHCIFYFDDYWDTLPQKSVSFKVDSKIVGTYELEKDNKLTVPKHVLATAGTTLEVGVIGYADDHQTVVPTSWCHIGKVKPGAMPGTPDIDDDTIIYYDGGVIV